MIQRVHYPQLRAVISTYNNETAGSQAVHLTPAVVQKLKACRAAYPLVRGQRADQPVTLTTAPPTPVPGLAGLGGPFDSATQSTTMTGREWMALLSRWRDVFNVEYFSYSGPRPGNFPGQIPQNFAFTPAHEAWLGTVLQGGVGRDTQQQQDASEVFVEGGRLWRGPPSPHRPAIDTSQSVTWFKGMGWEIFVLSHVGKLHMASHLAGLRHHSSLLGPGANLTQAKDAAAAGEMKVTNGRVQQLSVKTGHYQAKIPQMQQVVHWLMKRGTNLNGTTLLSFDGSLIAADASVWWNNTGRASYERTKTDRAMDWSRATQGGQPAVNAALIAHGWALVNHLGGWYWQKPDGSHASAREVRKALKTAFPHWQPVTTAGPADTPVASTI